MSRQNILQVSELTKKVRFILESELNTVWLTGEISNFVAAGSGHWYLSLKDARSQVRCAMFKGNNQRVRLQPKNGQQVLVKARVSLYEPRGDFQLILEQMEDAGDGLLRQQFEQLKNRLNAEGLFAQQTKQLLPPGINTVGIITSPTGAAVKDILTVLKRRNPAISAVIYPALVQGEYAVNDICHAISQANSRNECDVLIVGRGGGSLEDLWSFNEEAVVRAIHQSKIPTISAVGHEIDTTLSDYVADFRAPTPSAAAELVSQDKSELLDKLAGLKHRLTIAARRELSDRQKVSVNLQHRLNQVHPQQQLQSQQQKSDELAIRLKQAIGREQQRFRLAPEQLNTRLMHLSPQKHITEMSQTAQQNEQRIINAIKRIYRQKGEQFASIIEQLHIVSPLATLARGYSIVRDDKGNILRDSREVESGDSIAIQLSKGQINARVLANKE
ncbi:exodeoxyribonuclease VII large subunit [Thalassomonas actiniarum]|uniref:Exodeoxyribonuclease 7 large subunit n=1 Tax=Thalassomonas actiniarum TaxID=485447 RepID=A0AAE9YT03_9GAMM|nr:exodeoxyribonuclease VII large subunit [Thalassomonas actiniarum]WDD99913.1 exodeoxyribonuclease VII large subunit [Thalassomonas actiniarum]